MQKPELLERLEQGIVDILFTKRDGSNRLMKATLMMDLLPPHAKEIMESRAETSDLVTVWDVEAPGWRSFHISTIVAIT